MNCFRRFRFTTLRMLTVWLFCLTFSYGAAQSETLKVGKSGAPIYAQDNAQSERIETLPAGEEVTQVFQITGRGLWYPIRTQSGRFGWLRASDIEPVKGSEPPGTAGDTLQRFGAASTWIANSRGGRTLSGTWTGVIDSSTGTASGSWTVRDGSNRIILRGTWSAAKSEREWRGSWRAMIAGQTIERSGTWSAGVQIPPKEPLSSLFQLAVAQSLSGTWRSGSLSGGWSIRAVQ